MRFRDLSCGSSVRAADLGHISVLVNDVSRKRSRLPRVVVEKFIEVSEDSTFPKHRVIYSIDIGHMNPDLERDVIEMLRFRLSDEGI